MRIIFMAALPTSVFPNLACSLSSNCVWSALPLGTALSLLSPATISFSSMVAFDCLSSLCSSSKSSVALTELPASLAIILSIFNISWLSVQPWRMRITPSLNSSMLPIPISDRIRAARSGCSLMIFAVVRIFSSSSVRFCMAFNPISVQTRMAYLALSDAVPCL